MLARDLRLLAPARPCARVPPHQVRALASIFTLFVWPSWPGRVRSRAERERDYRATARAWRRPVRIVLRTCCRGCRAHRLPGHAADAVVHPPEPPCRTVRIPVHTPWGPSSAAANVGPRATSVTLAPAAAIVLLLAMNLGCGTSVRVPVHDLIPH